MQVQFGPAAMEKVPIPSLPVLPEAIKLTEISVTGLTGTYNIIVANEYVDLNGHPFINPEQKVQNKIAMVEYPGICMAESMQVACGRYSLAEIVHDNRHVKT